MGAFVDYTTHKKAFLIFFTLMSTLLPMVIVFTQNVPILVAKSVLEGISSTSLRVSKGPFALGIAGHENFEAIAKHTEIFEHSGSLVACAIAGAIGYILYPNVLPIFYVIGAFGSVAIVGLCMMTGRRNFMDDDLARNSPHHQRRRLPQLPPPQISLEPPPIENLTTKQISSDDNDDDCEEIMEIDSAVQRDQDIEKDPMRVDTNTTGTASGDPTNENDDQDSESLWTIFVHNRAMSFFCLSVFFFHLGNAAVLPVLGQVLALENKKSGIPYTASKIVVAQLSSFLGVYIIDSFVTRGFKINVPVMIGFGSLIPRVAIIILVLQYSRNPYVLIATQILDGVGAGVNGLSIMRVTKTLTEGTNRFGVVFGIANVSWGIGAALSNLITGYLISFWGYEVGFWFLLCPGFLSVFFMYVTKVAPPVLSWEKPIMPWKTSDLS